MSNDCSVKPCLSTTIFGKRPLADSLEPIVRAGYKYIEISRHSLDWAEAAPMISDLGLRVWAVHGRGAFFPAYTTKAERQKAMDITCAAMDEVAPHAPCPYVIHYFCNSSEPRVKDIWRETVEVLLAHCESLGLNLAMENMSYRPTRYYADSMEIADFVRSFGSPNLSVCFDFNHANIREYLVDVAANFAGLMSNIHVSDNRGQEEEHLPPGEGGIDFPRALRAVREAGYRGPLNLELHVGGDPDHDLLVCMRKWAESVASQTTAEVATESEGRRS